MASVSSVNLIVERVHRGLRDAEPCRLRTRFLFLGRRRRELSKFLLCWFVLGGFGSSSSSWRFLELFLDSLGTFLRAALRALLGPKKSEKCGLRKWIGV